MITEILYKKHCVICDNNIIVTGKVYKEERKTEITTRDENCIPSASLYGECGVMCLCGKTYRMQNRRAWHMLALD